MEYQDLKRQNRSKFIEENKQFIYDTTSYFCSKALNWKDDQELNIALIAFNSACESHKESKGNFLGFAYALIHSALIEYYLKSNNCPCFKFENMHKEYEDYINSLSELEGYFENQTRGIELTLLSAELRRYSLSLNNLSDISFSESSTKVKLLNIAAGVCKNDELIEILKSKGSLPMKKVSELFSGDLPIIKKFKNYLIFLIIILSSDKYIYLKAFLNIRVGDTCD